MDENKHIDNEMAEILKKAKDLKSLIAENEDKLDEREKPVQETQNDASPAFPPEKTKRHRPPKRKKAGSRNQLVDDKFKQAIDKVRAPEVTEAPAQEPELETPAEPAPDETLQMPPEITSETAQPVMPEQEAEPERKDDVQDESRMASEPPRTTAQQITEEPHDFEIGEFDSPTDAYSETTLDFPEPTMPEVPEMPETLEPETPVANQQEPAVQETVETKKASEPLAPQMDELAAAQETVKEPEAVPMDASHQITPEPEPGVTADEDRQDEALEQRLNEEGGVVLNHSAMDAFFEISDKEEDVPSILESADPLVQPEPEQETEPSLPDTENEPVVQEQPEVEVNKHLETLFAEDQTSQDQNGDALFERSENSEAGEEMPLFDTDDEALFESDETISDAPERDQAVVDQALQSEAPVDWGDVLPGQKQDEPAPTANVTDESDTLFDTDDPTLQPEAPVLQPESENLTDQVPQVEEPMREEPAIPEEDLFEDEVIDDTADLTPEEETASDFKVNHAAYLKTPIEEKAPQLSENIPWVIPGVAGEVREKEEEAEAQTLESPREESPLQEAETTAPVQEQAPDQSEGSPSEGRKAEEERDVLGVLAKLSKAKPIEPAVATGENEEPKRSDLKDLGTSGQTAPSADDDFFETENLDEPEPMADIPPVEDLFEEDDQPETEQTTAFEAEPVAEKAPEAEEETFFDEEPLFDEEPVFEREAVAEEKPAVDEKPVAEEPSVFEEQPMEEDSFFDEEPDAQTSASLFEETTLPEEKMEPEVKTPQLFSDDNGDDDLFESEETILETVENDWDEPETLFETPASGSNPEEVVPLDEDVAYDEKAGAMDDLDTLFESAEVMPEIPAAPQKTVAKEAVQTPAATPKPQGEETAAEDDFFDDGFFEEEAIPETPSPALSDGLSDKNQDLYDSLFEEDGQEEEEETPGELQEGKEPLAASSSEDNSEKTSTSQVETGDQVGAAAISESENQVMDTVEPEEFEEQGVQPDTVSGEAEESVPAKTTGFFGRSKEILPEIDFQGDRSKRWVPAICLALSLIAAGIFSFFCYRLCNAVDYLAWMVTAIVMVVSFDIPKKVMVILTPALLVLYAGGQLYMTTRGFSFTVITFFMMIIMAACLLSSFYFSHEMIYFRRQKRELQRQALQQTKLLDQPEAAGEDTPAPDDGKE